MEMLAGNEIVTRHLSGWKKSRRSTADGESEHPGTGQLNLDVISPILLFASLHKLCSV